MNLQGHGSPHSSQAPPDGPPDGRCLSTTGPQASAPILCLGDPSSRVRATRSTISPYTGPAISRLMSRKYPASHKLTSRFDSISGMCDLFSQIG